MSRDKQTEIMELARELCGEGEQHEDCFHCPTLRCCGVQKFARELYNKGWRKSADVAEEIFEEIDSLLEGEEKRYENLSDEADDPRFTNEYWEASLTISSIRTILAELKKKYTESENNNE